MLRNNRFLRGPLPWLIAIALLGFLGNRAGHLIARAGYFRVTDDGERTAVQGGGGRDHPARPQRVSSAPARRGAVDAALEKLHEISRNSPGIYVDWEAQAAIQRVLAELTPEELGELYARLDGQDETGGLDDLSRLVGARWAASDPDAAIKAALAKSKMRGEHYAIGIFREWAADHPREALAWLDAAEMDPRMAKRKDEMRGGIVSGLVERDFALAKEEFAKLDTATADDVMNYWGISYVVDAAMREKLIEYAKSTGRPGDFAALNQGLVREWPENDPLGLLHHLEDLRDYLESDAVPAGSRPETDAAAVGIAIQREYHDAAMEWWMGRYSQSAETPQTLREAMRTWSRQKPDVTLQWLAAQPDSPQRDVLGAVAMAAYLEASQFPRAAAMMESIHDPGLRQAGMERLEMLWTEQDPAAAEAWKNTHK